jgi:hypothetical protein
MNRPLLGRVSSFLFFFYFFSFGIFFLVSALRFTSDVVLPSLRWAYALDRAFVLFIDYLLPVHAAAIAVAASLSAGSESTSRGAQSRPFNRIAASSLVMFLLLSAAYTLVFEITYPAARRGLTDLQHTTSLARQLSRESEAAQQRGDYRTGLGLANRYLSMDPGNREMQDRKAALESLVAHQEAPPQPPKPAGEEPGSVLDAQALIMKAQKYFDQQDWFSAHYYAQKANLLDPRRTDALRLAAARTSRAQRFTSTRGTRTCSSAGETTSRPTTAFRSLRRSIRRTRTSRPTSTEPPRHCAVSPFSWMKRVR